MKSFRKNTFGFTHHAILGLVVIAVVAFVGVKVLTGIHAQTPVYVVEGYVTHNGNPVAGAIVTHYGVPPTSNIAGFSVHTGAKGWYQFDVKPNATFRMFAFSNKCSDGTSTSYSSANVKFQTGSTGGSLRKDLNLNQKSTGCTP